jgi:fructokinase
VQTLLSRKGPTVTGFCDINMRPPHINMQAVTESLNHVDILKLNDDELVTIQRTFNAPASPEEAISWLMEAFGISAVALTQGSRGSTLYSRDVQIDIGGGPETTIVDTVGAGDAYAAIMAAGHIRGRSWKATIERASRFAAGICGIPGAVPDDPRFYSDFQ